MRALVLLAVTACAKEPVAQPPPAPAPTPSVAPAPEPAVPACDDQGLRQCAVDVQTSEAGSPLTLVLTNTATQGVDPGETFTEPYWDCDVFVISPGKVVRETHHHDDLHVDLAPGPYLVRLDACFGCRKDVPIAITRGHSVVVNARCHDTGA